MKKQNKRQKITAILLIMLAVMLLTPTFALAAGANPVDEPATKLVDLLLTVFRWVGIFGAIISLVFFFISWVGKHDRSEMITSGLVFFACILIIFIKDVLNLVGITW